MFVKDILSELLVVIVDSTLKVESTEFSRLAAAVELCDGDGDEDLLDDPKDEEDGNTQGLGDGVVLRDTDALELSDADAVRESDAHSVDERQADALGEAVVLRDVDNDNCAVKVAEANADADTSTDAELLAKFDAETPDVPDTRFDADVEAHSVCVSDGDDETLLEAAFDADTSGDGDTGAVSDGVRDAE